MQSLSKAQYIQKDLRFKLLEKSKYNNEWKDKLHVDINKNLKRGLPFENDKNLHSQI